jgi:anti-anti-sigma regulatory factor
LRCTGDEDRTTQARRRCALARAFTAQRDVIVDLAGLAFADTSLMIDLAVLSRRLRRRGRRLLIREPQPQIRILIELVGLDRLPGVSFDRPAPALP